MYVSNEHVSNVTMSQCNGHVNFSEIIESSMAPMRRLLPCLLFEIISVYALHRVNSKPSTQIQIKSRFELKLYSQTNNTVTSILRRNDLQASV